MENHTTSLFWGQKFRANWGKFTQGGILLLCRHERGEGGSQMSTFFYKGEGGSGNIYIDIWPAYFSQKLGFLKKNFIANEYFFQEKYFFFQFFSIHFIFAGAIKIFLCFARGEGQSNVYVVFMGGLPNVYVYLQGGGGVKNGPNLVYIEKVWPLN